METYFWPVVAILAYIGAIILDNKLNMKQEEIIKSYFPDENKGEGKK